MAPTNQTILDHLFNEYTMTCQVHPVIVTPDEMVHVVGAQEPIRDQPDARSQMLLTAGWLKVEHVRTELPDSEIAGRVSAVQQAARSRLKQMDDKTAAADRDQVRWLVEKTRTYESKQQIAQRVWLALVLYNLGCRGLAFDPEGQIIWQGGMAAKIGTSPDANLDLAWSQTSRRVYVSSFRQPDGTVVRGKGRHRWNVYCLTIDSAAAPLFDRYAQKVHEKVALIVASETYATQPLPASNFYGGSNEFQQACIDAQDQKDPPFDHILVLSPAHGVVSLDDVVPSEQKWDDVMERRLWAWPFLASQRLGKYLFGSPEMALPTTVKEMNWWAWLNPESRYEFTLFGGGFSIRIFMDHLLHSRIRMPGQWPIIEMADWRDGYQAGGLDNGFGFDFEDDVFDEFGDLDDFEPRPGDEDDYESILQDIDQLLEWATEWVELVNIYIPPIGETWELAPDEALIPVRLLSQLGMDFEDLLDLLTDITVVLEQPLPLGLLISANMVVSVMLQVTHSLVHKERESIPDMLGVFPEGVLRQYVEKALQENKHEDQLCACLTLAEQMHLLAMAIPPATNEQLIVWLQTYISARMRPRLADDLDEKPKPRKKS